MRNVIFDVIPIAHSMNTFDGDLLVGSCVNKGTVEKGEKLLLCSINVDHVLSHINDFSV